MSELINGLYNEGAMIGQGAFGQIFLGRNMQTQQPVAIKKETANCKNPQLAYEAKIYKCLEGGIGIPRVYFQQDNRTTNIMVMDLLGPSLEDMFNYCYRQFSVKTVLMLGIELLTRLEFIHHRNFIHRDIKPDNFALGLGERANVIFVLDFGLAKRYRTPGTKEHIPYRENKSLTGTPRYASINNHLGIEQSRRDDLESLGYVLVYFLKGRLPWQGLNGTAKKQKYEMIMKCKTETSLDTLCEDLPVQIKEYLTYCRKLGFDQSPDYRHLRRLFKNALEERKLKNDGVYDWMSPSQNFNAAKLPSHCRDSRGAMLAELKRPAPTKFREMYKEEAYRQKSTAPHLQPTPKPMVNPVMPSPMFTHSRRPFPAVPEYAPPSVHMCYPSSSIPPRAPVEPMSYQPSHMYYMNSRNSRNQSANVPFSYQPRANPVYTRKMRGDEPIRQSPTGEIIHEPNLRRY